VFFRSGRRTTIYIPCPNVGESWACGAPDRQPRVAAARAPLQRERGGSALGNRWWCSQSRANASQPGDFPARRENTGKILVLSTLLRFLAGKSHAPAGGYAGNSLRGRAGNFLRLTGTGLSALQNRDAADEWQSELSEGARRVSATRIQLRATAQLQYGTSCPSYIIKAPLCSLAFKPSGPLNQAPHRPASSPPRADFCR
jgi:hypothetical protein